MKKNSFLSIVFIFMLLLLARCQSKEKPDTKENSSKEIPQEAYLETSTETRMKRQLSSDDSNQLTYEKLKKILQDYNFSRIEDLLKHLAHGMPSWSSLKGYLGHHTYGFDSKSLHGSSYENPRAIVYGETGRFIITFNNDPKHSAYEMLEVVSFNDKTKKFEFREIKFLNDENQIKNKPMVDYSKKIDGKYVEQGFKISPIGGPKYEGNYLNEDLETEVIDRLALKKSAFPQGKCLQCHTNGRPIWEAYNVWPGFYGGDDDVFFFTLNGRPKKKLAEVSQKMKMNFANFRNNRFKTRYQYLGEHLKEPVTQFGVRPNGFLNVLLVKLNHERIKRLIEEYGPPQLSPEKCQELAFKKFTKEAVILNRNLLDHRLAIRAQTIKETAPPESIDYLIEYDRNYHKMDYYRFDQGQIINSTMETYAALEYLFPKLQVQTFPSSLYEGLYEFRSAVNDPNSDGLASNFLYRARKLCGL